MAHSSQLGAMYPCLVTGTPDSQFDVIELGAYKAKLPFLMLAPKGKLFFVKND